MGMWEGLYTGLQNIRAREEREMEREEARRIREEDTAFRREQFSWQQAQAHRQMVADLYPKLQERSAAASELANQTSILRGYLGDSPIVDKLRATGNTEAIQRVISNLEAGYTAAQEEGRGEEYIQAWRTTLENDARITEATQGQIDFSLFDNVVSPEDLTSLGLPTSFTVPGTIEVAPVIYQPRATIDDLNALDRRIANTAIGMGNTEMRRLREATTRINAMLSNPSLDPNIEASLRGDLAAIVDRQMMIEGAIDDTKGDNPSFDSISNIYGTAARDFVINSSPRAVDINSISPTFRETISAQPIVVVSPTHLQVLYETGAINDSSVILYEGQEILVGDIPEREDQ